MNTTTTPTPSIARRVRATSGNWYGPQPWPAAPIPAALRLAARMTAHRAAAAKGRAASAVVAVHDARAPRNTHAADGEASCAIPTARILAGTTEDERDTAADLMIGAALLSCARAGRSFGTMNAANCARTDAHHWINRRPAGVALRTAAGTAVAWRDLRMALEPIGGLNMYPTAALLARAARTEYGRALLEDARVERDTLTAARLIYGAAITLAPEEIAAAVEAMGGAIHAGQRASARSRALAAYAVEHARADADGAVAWAMFSGEEEGDGDDEAQDDGGAGGAGDAEDAARRAEEERRERERADSLQRDRDRHGVDKTGDREARHHGEMVRVSRDEELPRVEDERAEVPTPNDLATPKTEPVDYMAVRIIGVGGAI